MKQKKCIVGILLLGAVCAQANNYEVTSPDGRLAVKVEYVDGKQCIINKKGWQISKSVTLFILCFNPFFPRIGYLLELLVFEDQSICICMIDGNWLLSANLFCKNLLTQIVQDVILDSALYRTGTKLWVVTYLGKITDGGWSPAEIEALRLQHLLYSLHLKFYNLGNLLLGQRLEGNDIINTVQELRTEGLAQHLTACVGSHDDDGVLEVDYTTLVVGQPTIVQYLQQSIEYIRMRLLYLIEENHTVWFAAYSLGQLATFIVTNIPWRRTDQTGYAKLLLIFTHINSGHHRLVIEQILSQRLGKFRLTYTGSTEEDEAGDRTLRILQTGTAAANGITYCGDSLVLSDDSLVEFFFQTPHHPLCQIHERRTGYRTEQ